LQVISPDFKSTFNFSIFKNEYTNFNLKKQKRYPL